MAEEKRFRVSKDLDENGERLRPILGPELAEKLGKEIHDRALNAGADVVVGVFYQDREQDVTGLHSFNHATGDEMVNLMVAICQKRPEILLETLRRMSSGTIGVALAGRKEIQKEATPTELKQECDKCQNRQPIPGDNHIMCLDPDPDMVGNDHGVKKGWFNYPVCFDPIWKMRRCRHFKPKDQS